MAENGSVFQIPGACLLTRRDVLEEVGPFDENFFVWFEDVDWCYRAHRSNHRSTCCEEAVFIHEGGKSFAPLSKQMRKKWFFRSMIQYFKKHKGGRQWRVLVGLLIAEEAAVYIISSAFSRLFPWWEKMRSRSERAHDFLSFMLRYPRYSTINYP